MASHDYVQRRSTLRRGRADRATGARVAGVLSDDSPVVSIRESGEAHANRIAALASRMEELGLTGDFEEDDDGRGLGSSE